MYVFKRLALIQCPSTGDFRLEVPAWEAVFNSFSQLIPEQRSYQHRKGKLLRVKIARKTLNVEEQLLIFSTPQILFLKIQLLNSTKVLFVLFLFVFA